MAIVAKSADQGYKSTLFKGVYSILRALCKTCSITEIWIVQEGGSFSKVYVEGTQDYNAFSFSNATEIMEKLAPDLVVTPGDYEYLARSILIAASKLKIPTVIMLSTAFYSIQDESIGTGKLILGRLHLLEDHGRSIVRRYFFLIKTIIHSGSGARFLISSIFKDLYMPLASMEPRLRFGGKFVRPDLFLANNPEIRDLMVRNGIEENTIAVVGDCSMDEIYDQIANMKQGISASSTATSNTVTILYLTTAMVEHGYWTKDMRRDVVTKAVKVIKQQLPRAKLIFKIHPTSERLGDYREIIDTIDPDVPILQHENLLELLNNSEVIVTFGQSTAVLYALLLRKKVIILNIFNEDPRNNLYLQEKVAVECKSTEELISALGDPNHTNTNSLDVFVTKTIFKFDGNCGNRAANRIMSFLDERKG